MTTQHQVILSLGSNQGDRLENISKAIEAIHAQAATVVRVSRLYESASWGFEAPAFYNCALMVHTLHSAEVLLEKLLKIETFLGRVRSENQGYQSRVIDIDMIAYDEEIIDSETKRIESLSSSSTFSSISFFISG